MMKRVILLLLFLAFINVVSAGVVDTKNMTIIHPCTNTSEGTCETMVRNGLTVYEGLVFPESIDINNTTGLGYISWGIANDNNSRGAISHPCSPTVNTSGYSRSCSAFYVNGKLSSITKFTAVIHPCTGTSS